MKQDSELIRMQGLLTVLDELNERLFKLRRDLGDTAYTRVLKYLSSRKGHVIYRFNQNP